MVLHHPLAPHPSPASPPTGPDLTDLVDRLGDPQLVGAVVDTYLAALPERLDAIAAARHTPDEESVRAAHSLRSASALLGLTPLAEACGALEAVLRADQTAAAPALVDVVLERAGLARRSLDALSAEVPPA